MRKIRIIATIIALYVMTIGLQVFAAQRDYEINVTKDYLSAKISITVKEDIYNLVVVSPKGVEYPVTDIDDTNKECVINEPLEKGKWVVRATTKEESTEVSEVEETSETEEIPATEVEKPIEGISIKFEGSFEKTLDVNKDITVASDIVGLKMYFKDDSFVAEWTDTTVGRINIEVTDEITSESLDKRSVDDRYYELPLKDSVDSIVVKLVPASSSNEKGAEKLYTFKFDNHPTATVTYEDIKITNRDSIGVHITVDDNSYKAMMMDNGKQVSITEELKPGEYDFTIPTEVGDNNYLVYLIDKDGNMRSTAGYVEKDVVAPILQLQKEYVNISTHDESIEIAGKVEDYNTFTINDAEVKVEGDHTFRYVYELKEGINNIEIVASDEAGNISKYDATVTRIIEIEEPIPWLKIILIVTVVVLVGLYIRAIIRKYNNREYEEEKTDKKPKKATDNAVSKGVMYDILSLAIPCLIICIIFKFIITISVVVSGSMEPTLMTGSTSFYNNLYYKTGHLPKRGDIVIFNSKEYNEVFGKRIIGLPGDTIEFKDGYVVVNGQYLDESAYIPEDVETNSAGYDDIFVVPDNCYFMLGDNREYSEARIQHIQH